eukprot:TRINITY_DN28794_c0_g1_i1.p2 TRINITY_DN28794_c0_g1~~TRINITY_DN28794_c0_g1_i1.p2  ORF type:complete len:115 (-),score=36.01 TRINITY_DN28794_c0_g1_i1:282-626(-)
MIRRPPRSTQSRSSAASDVYKRQQRERPEPRNLIEHQHKRREDKAIRSRCKRHRALGENHEQPELEECAQPGAHGNVPREVGGSEHSFDEANVIQQQHAEEDLSGAREYEVARE